MVTPSDWQLASASASLASTLPKRSGERHIVEGEIEQGRAAKRTATRLLQGQTVEFVRVGRSYRRTVALVWLRGRSLSAELIRIGVAKPWPHHAPKPDWCPS